MLLEIKSVTKSFQRNGASFFAVSYADFSLNNSDFVFITGRSGSGKTTLLNLIAGLLEPSSGQVLFNGKDVTALSDTDRSFYRNECIGFVPQSLGYLPNLSVFDNVRVPFFLFHRDGDSDGRAASLLEMMGIVHLKDEMPKNLSGGEIKRMLIARSLINAPQLLIADEPTANLDGETAIEVLDAITEVHRQGTAVLIVTHDSSIINNRCATYRMNEGVLSAT